MENHIDVRKFDKEFRYWNDPGRKKKWWTKEEEENLRIGILKYGKNNVKL